MTLKSNDECPEYIMRRCTRYDNERCIQCGICNNKVYQVCCHCPIEIQKIFSKEFEFALPYLVALTL